MLKLNFSVFVFFFAMHLLAQDSLLLNLPKKVEENGIMNSMLGKFVDDYGIKYTITESVWIQESLNTHHIVKWNVEEGYLIAKNDSINVDERGLYSRIDFMRFMNQGDYKWGYCLTSFDAKTSLEAEKHVAPNRKKPKVGCNGFPFSRMKEIE